MHTRTLSRHLSYANVVATLALMVALTGGAYAATQLPKNSVGSKQVTDHSLKAKDFQPGQLPAGPQGPKGADGRPGKDGAAGPSVLAVGSKHGEYTSTVSNCTPFDFLGGHFTVPQKAVLHVDSTFGYRVGTGRTTTRSPSSRATPTSSSWSPTTPSAAAPAAPRPLRSAGRPSSGWRSRSRADPSRTLERVLA